MAEEDAQEREGGRQGLDGLVQEHGQAQLEGLGRGRVQRGDSHQRERQNQDDSSGFEGFRHRGLLKIRSATPWEFGARSAQDCGLPFAPIFIQGVENKILEMTKHVKFPLNIK